MHSEYKVKRLTSLFQSCNHCGLPVINCICGRVPKLNTRAQLWIISSEREFYKPSNTARLLKLMNPNSTEIFLWERTKEPEELVSNLDKDIYQPYLLFPAEDEESKKRRVQFCHSEKTPAFVLIDGTWKEARRIFRKSDYLANLPIISLKPIQKSKYHLRKGAPAGNLCTIEAAIEALRINGETENVLMLENGYDLFLKGYMAGISGHATRN